MVRVPVLSEQITEVQPRVSTEGKDLTIAFFFAIRRVPKARQVVITAGKPSGMAATVSVTHRRHTRFWISISLNARPSGQRSPGASGGRYEKVLIDSMNKTK